MVGERLPPREALDRTCLPRADAHTLPAECYTSRAWLDAEIQSIFARTWVFLGRADEIAQPGEYLADDLPGLGPVVAVRGDDMQLRAFANVCRHRGAKLLAEGRGKLKAGLIVCPYHAWTYDSKGGLRGAPKMGRKLCKADFPLVPVHLAEHRGLLFVHGGGAEGSDPPPLADSLGNCPRLVLDRWPLEDMVTVSRREYDVQCNWKFVFDNTCEWYHLDAVHKTTIGSMKACTVEEAHGEAPTGEWDAIAAYIENESVVPLPGEPTFPSVSDGTYFTNLFFAGLQINLTHDCAYFLRMLPSTSPGQSRLSTGLLLPRATVESPDFTEEKLALYKHRLHVLALEDNSIAENQQRSVNSPFYRPGVYAHSESNTHSFNKWVVQRVLSDAAQY